MLHVAPESKLQLVHCKLSPKFPLGHLSLPYIYAVDAYIFWSLLFLLFLHARLPFSLKRTCFHCFSFSFGGFGNFEIRLSSDPHLKHFRGVRSVRLLSESPNARAFSFSCMILLNNFSAEWLAPTQKNALFLENICSLTISTTTWAAVTM